VKQNDVERMSSEKLPPTQSRKKLRRMGVNIYLQRFLGYSAYSAEFRELLGGKHGKSRD
jgi:hypothetical protein